MMGEDESEEAAPGELASGGDAEPAQPAALPAALVLSTGPSVFISYRIKSDAGDARVARAFKKLIQTSIDPEPEVFVASDGGLRPAAIGYNQQLALAAQSAKAFVGIITKAFRDREWLAFEAGAAWGRGQVYAPLLIDTTPSDLPSTIAHYQALPASDKEQVRDLVRRIAECVEGDLKPNFGNRFRAFASVVESYNRPEPPPNDEEHDESDLGRALALLREGKEDEAAPLFAELEAKAATDRERIDIRFRRLIGGKEAGADLLRKIETLEEPFRSSAEAKLWIGVLERSHSAAIRSLEECLASDDAGEFEKTFARGHLARRRVSLGDDAGAVGLLVDGLRSANRWTRSDAANTWLELWPKGAALPRVAIVALGLLAMDSNELRRAGTEVALEQAWPSLALHLALGSVDESATTANNLGRALTAAKLLSLAARAYRRAIDGGVTVAKSNLASLLLTKPCPAVGLEILEGHTGSFDSRSRSGPYRVRADLEAALEEEEAQQGNIHDAGRRLWRQFGAICEAALAAPNNGIAASLSLGGVEYRSVQDGLTVTLTTAKEETTRLVCSDSSLGLWEERGAAGALVGIFYIDTSGELVGVRAAFEDDEPKPTPVRFRR